MHGYIKRAAENDLQRALARSPAVAILGPRQCGKSTMAKKILETVPAVYLDLQDRTDRNKLTEPELFFDRYRDQLICLDEIQLLPEFFSVLRSEIDKDRTSGFIKKFTLRPKCKVVVECVMGCVMGTSPVSQLTPQFLSIELTQIACYII